MKRTAGADVPAVCFLRETLKMGRGLFDAYIVTILVQGAAISKVSPVHSAHIVFHRRRELS